MLKRADRAYENGNKRCCWHGLHGRIWGPLSDPPSGRDVQMLWALDPACEPACPQQLFSAATTARSDRLRLSFSGACN